MWCINIKKRISKSSDLDYKELTTGFDLNNALGRYRASQTAVVKSLLNAPSDFNLGGELVIDWYSAAENNAYGMQIARLSRSGVSFAYTRSKSTPTLWGSWTSYIKNSDLMTKAVEKTISGGIFSDMSAVATDDGALWIVHLKNGNTVRFAIKSNGSVVLQRRYNGSWLAEIPIANAW